MIAETRTYTTPGAKCPGCGGAYPGESLPFLYADDLGARCPGCGSVLIVGNDHGTQRNSSTSCHLMLSEGLEASGLHAMLAEGKKGLRVLVNRSGLTRTVSLASPTSPEEPGFAAEDGTR